MFNQTFFPSPIIALLLVLALSVSSLSANDHSSTDALTTGVMLCASNGGSWQKVDFVVLQISALSKLPHYLKQSLELIIGTVNQEQTLLLGREFVQNGHPMPVQCWNINPYQLTTRLPDIQRLIDNYQASMVDSNPETLTILAIPPVAYNDGAVNRVRPVIMAGALTYGLIYFFSPGHAFYAAFFVAFSCCFRPEQCQEVMDSFYEFFADLGQKAFQRQGHFTGNGQRLGSRD